jgi:hypothetical protein
MRTIAIHSNNKSIEIPASTATWWTVRWPPPIIPKSVLLSQGSTRLVQAARAAALPRALELSRSLRVMGLRVSRYPVGRGRSRQALRRRRLLRRALLC